MVDSVEILNLNTNTDETDDLQIYIVDSSGNQKFCGTTDVTLNGEWTRYNCSLALGNSINILRNPGSTKRVSFCGLKVFGYHEIKYNTENPVSTFFLNLNLDNTDPFSGNTVTKSNVNFDK